jgi:hypothetical protein
MSAQHGKFIPCLRNVAPNQIAGIGVPSDRAQRHLFTATGDHDRRPWLLHRLGLEDRIIDMKKPSVEGRPWLGPHPRDQLNCFVNFRQACLT